MWNYEYDWWIRVQVCVKSLMKVVLKHEEFHWKNGLSIILEIFKVRACTFVSYKIMPFEWHIAHYI